MTADRPSRASRSETDRLIELMLDTALDAVVVMDRRGCVTAWSDTARATFGWEAAEAVGRELAQLVIPEAARERHRQGLAHYLATGEGPMMRRRIETEAVGRSGAEIPVELSIVPLGTDEEPVFVGFLRDLTEARRNEAMLRRRAREAELVNQVTLLAGECGSLEEVLPACLAAVCELTGWPAAHVWLPNQANPPRLVSSGIWHGDAERFAPLHAATTNLSFGRGEGMPGRIWRRGGPFWLAVEGEAGAETAAKFPRAAVTLGLGVRAVFGFPILIGGEVAAILEFFSMESVRPDAGLMLTTRTIGEQVGRVLERRQVQDHQALLLAELDHRAMNLLSVVLGMADQTGRQAGTFERFRADFTARLTSLARAYGLLTSRGWRPTELGVIIEQIVRPYVPVGDGRLQLDCEPAPLPPKASMALSMVLHELAANATKYGAFSTPSGRLQVKVAVLPGPEGRRIAMEWRESGVPGVRPPQRRGFGARLIEATMKRELSGELEVEYAHDGLSYHFEFPERRL